MRSFGCRRPALRSWRSRSAGRQAGSSAACAERAHAAQAGCRVAGGGRALEARALLAGRSRRPAQPAGERVQSLAYVCEVHRWCPLGTCVIGRARQRTGCVERWHFGAPLDSTPPAAIPAPGPPGRRVENKEGRRRKGCRPERRSGRAVAQQETLTRNAAVLPLTFLTVISSPPRESWWSGRAAVYTMPGRPRKGRFVFVPGEAGIQPSAVDGRPLVNRLSGSTICARRRRAAPGAGRVQTRRNGAP